METQTEKIMRISALLENETLKLTRSQDTWLKYLEIAARLYKYGLNLPPVQCKLTGLRNLPHICNKRRRLFQVIVLPERHEENIF